MCIPTLGRSMPTEEFLRAIRIAADGRPARGSAGVTSTAGTSLSETLLAIGAVGAGRTRRTAGYIPEGTD